MLLAAELLDNRTGHQVGRLLLERLYRETTGENLPEISVSPRGKPYFSSSPWYFSISHTRNHAFCCLSKHNVGLDAEEIGRPVSPELITRWLSPSEQARLGEDAADGFLRLWVLKEAEAKLRGCGLGNWMKSTDFHPDDPRIQIIHGCYVAVLEESNAI